MSVEALELKINVCEARLQLGLSQQEFAEMAGVTAKTLSRAETGQRIQPLSAQAILDALNAERQRKALTPLSLKQLGWEPEEYSIKGKFRKG